MQNEIIEWCPDVQGPCIKSDCVAFADKLTYGIENASFFINRFVSSGKVDSLPLTFELDVSFCKKYRKFVDKESKGIYNMFMSELEGKG